MPSQRLCVILWTSVAGLLMVASLWAQTTIQPSQHHRYKLVDVGTFGGPASSINDGNSGNNAVSVVNNRGTMVGWADTAAPDPFPTEFCFNENCFVSHAFQLREGVRTNLGALDHHLSSQAVWVSKSGLIAGTSENGETDPLFPGFPEFRAVLWSHAHIKNLGTLPGGFESAANAVNSQGQVIGWATNSTPDGESMAGPGFFPTQTRAFLWQKDTMRDLGTLGGNDAIAQFINERGQVVGWSYTGGTPPQTCIFSEATDSFIWDEKNGMRDLGTLGGTCVIATGINNQSVVIGDNVNDQSLQRAFIWRDGAIEDLGGSIGGQQTGAEAINEAGEVAGFATLAGEALFHAVLWKQVGEVTDLGALGSDECSFAASINSKAQVVGGSAVGCVFDTQARAVLWENGAIFDLNTLIAPGASLTLQLAQDVNDRGEIAGGGVDAEGNSHAFLLIPCDEDHPGVEGCDYNMADARTMVPVPPPSATRGATSSRQVPRGPRSIFTSPLRFGQYPGPWKRVSQSQMSTSIRSSGLEPVMEVEQCPGNLANNTGADPAGDSLPFGGRCLEDNGKLTGSCILPIHVGPSGCYVTRGAKGCISGTKAKKPGIMGCCGFIACTHVTVDLASRCLL